jgi:hypothetical protein
MSVAARWKLTMNTPFGVQTPLLSIEQKDGAYGGTLAGATGTAPLERLKVDGASVSFTANVTTPMGTFPVSFSATVEGDAMTGRYETMMGATDFSGVRDR